MSDVRFGNFLAMKMYSNFAKSLAPKSPSGPSYQERQAARKYAESQGKYGGSDYANLQLLKDCKKKDAY